MESPTLSTKILLKGRVKPFREKNPIVESIIVAND
jgi:hypothetical protein